MLTLSTKNKKFAVVTTKFDVYARIWINGYRIRKSFIPALIRLTKDMMMQILQIAFFHFIMDWVLYRDLQRVNLYIQLNLLDKGWLGDLTCLTHPVFLGEFFFFSKNGKKLILSTLKSIIKQWKHNTSLNRLYNLTKIAYPTLLEKIKKLIKKYGFVL